jgi:GlpG protein
MIDGTATGRRWRITFNAPAVLGFAALCLCATILDQLTGGAANRLAFSTYRSSPLSPLTYVRLFTHVLGHAGWDHLIGNMSYILLLGPLLEEKYGSRTIVEIIALTALATGLVNSLLFSNIALCGASGVCFAFILLSSVTSLGEGEIPLTFILVAVLFLGQQVVDGIFVRDNISNLSHILGGIVGAGCGFALSRR